MKKILGLPLNDRNLYFSYLLSKAVPKLYTAQQTLLRAKAVHINSYLRVYQDQDYFFYLSVSPILAKSFQSRKG